MQGLCFKVKIRFIKSLLKEWFEKSFASPDLKKNVQQMVGLTSNKNGNINSLNQILHMLSIQAHTHQTKTTTTITQKHCMYKNIGFIWFHS